jgi:hypothetical protein
MFLFRFLLFFLLGGAAICFGFYIATGKEHFRRWGIIILKWTLIAAFFFFGVLIIGRIA